MSKRTRASASEGEPSRKKTRKGSEAVASTQVSEIILSGIEEQKEEEEEAVTTLRSRGCAAGAPQS